MQMHFLLMCQLPAYNLQWSESQFSYYEDLLLLSMRFFLMPVRVLMFIWSLESLPPSSYYQCLKFSKPGFSSTWTVNVRMFRLVLEKAEEPEIKLLTSAGSSKKQESSRETPISALLTTPKPLTVWITINCGKFWKRWECQTTWPASWEICTQVRKQQLELDTEQQTGSQ